MRTVVDLNKVQYCTFWWRNQQGLYYATKPKVPSVNGTLFDKDECAPAVESLGWPRETMITRAKRRGMIDIWTPEITLHFASNHTVKYQGKRAQSIWREWNKRQFKKKEKKNVRD